MTTTLLPRSGGLPRATSRRNSTPPTTPSASPPGDSQRPRALCADGYHQRVVALAQLGQRYVDTNLAVGDGFHAEGFDDGRFGADDVAGQAILRDAKREHPAEDGLDFVDRDLEPEQSEVVSRRQTGWPGADDAHRLTIRQRNVAVESGLQEREKFFTGIADAVRMPRRGLLRRSGVP